MAIYGKVASNLALREVIGVPKTKRIGLGWPIGKNPREGYFNKSSSMALIKSQLTQLIRTRKGERVMMPNFGLNIENYLFESLTASIATQIVEDIKRSVRIYAPNVKLLKVRVFSDENLKGYGMAGLLINLTVMPFEENQSIDVDIVI